MRKIIFIGITIFAALGICAAIVVPVAVAISIKNENINKALKWCSEEFTFDYHEEPLINKTEQVKNNIYKVELFSENYYAVYLYNVDNEIGFNYSNGSN